jgi:hypothetical protein
LIIERLNADYSTVKRRITISLKGRRDMGVVVGEMREQLAYPHECPVRFCGRQYVQY